MKAEIICVGTELLLGDIVISIERAKEFVASKGMYLDSSVIAHPDRRMIDSLL